MSSSSKTCRQKPKTSLFQHQVKFLSSRTFSLGLLFSESNSLGVWAYEYVIPKTAGLNKVEPFTFSNYKLDIWLKDTVEIHLLLFDTVLNSLFSYKWQQNWFVRIIFHAFVLYAVLKYSLCFSCFVYDLICIYELVSLLYSFLFKVYSFCVH